MKIAACEVRVYLGPEDTDRLDTLCVQQGKARDELLRQWVRERLRVERNAPSSQGR